MDEHLSKDEIGEILKDWYPLFRAAYDETERVSERLETDFKKVSGIDLIFDVHVSMIYWLAQRLIELPGTDRRDPVELAMIQICSRLFTECLAGYMMCKRGLILPAREILRGTLETTMLGCVVLENRQIAENWIEGKAKYTGSSLQNRSSLAKQLHDRYYASTSSDAHPSRDSRRTHVVDLNDGIMEAEVLFYGGRYSPRTALATACEFGELVITLLEKFYRHYGAKLAELNMLFMPGTVKILEDHKLGASQDPSFMDRFLKVGRMVLDESRVVVESMPEYDFDLKNVLWGSRWGRLLSSYAANTDTGPSNDD
jgi:hypothetical protein